MSLICSKNKWQALIKQVQFHITENVWCLDFDSVGKTVCQPQHCPSLVWRVEIQQKTIRSLRKFTVGRHALNTSNSTSVDVTKGERYHGLFKCTTPHSSGKGWKNASGQERDVSTAFSIRHRYANPLRKSRCAPARQH